MATLPSTPWTNIDSVRVAVDAPVSTDLWTDTVTNLNFLYAGLTIAGGKNLAVFTTPGAGTWSPPAGVTSCWIEMIGGGAGGGLGGLGGGSGAYQIWTVTGLTGATINLNIGGGGTGGSGGSGGNTWFGSSSSYTAAGGTAGSGGTPILNSTTWGSSNGAPSSGGGGSIGPFLGTYSGQGNSHGYGGGGDAAGVGTGNAGNQGAMIIHY